MEDYFGIITYLPVNLIRDDQSLARLKFREIGRRLRIRKRDKNNKIPPLEERNFRGNAVWKLVEYAWTWLILDATVNKQQKVSQITKG